MMRALSSTGLRSKEAKRMEELLPPGVKEMANYGVLGAIMMFLMFCFYKSGKWLGVKLEPVITSHKGLVDQLSSSDARQTEALAKIATVVEKLGEHHDIIPRIDKRVGEIHERMTKGDK